MNEVTFTILKIVLSAVSAVISLFVVPLLKRWMENNKNDEMLKMIEKAVKAAEQTFNGSGLGADKKQDVMDFISDWLEKNRITVSHKELDRYVEAAVYDMNNQ